MVQVCAVSSPDRPRYSIFGWFLEEGKLYDLYQGDDSGGYGGEGRKKAIADEDSAGTKGNGGGQVEMESLVAGRRKRKAELDDGAGSAEQVERRVCKPRKIAKYPAGLRPSGL